MKKSRYKRAALRASEGLLSTVTDLILFQVYFISASVGKTHTSRGVYQTLGEASDVLEEINFKTFQQAFNRLRRKGLIETVKEQAYFKPQITADGQKRLGEIIPTYKIKRIWDNRIYLITYDVAEERRSDRDILREMLKRIGCAYLQNSVWLTPYNPRGVLESFVEEHNLHGSIIVSDTGTNGAVGGESIKGLITRVYNLDNLNKDYSVFLKEFSGSRKNAPKESIAFHYLSLLSRDPQLPFELLPSAWLGDEAYALYDEVINC